MRSNPDAPYSVGYKRPPIKTRFKKGQSGNPTGRKREIRTIEMMIVEELAMSLTFVENGTRSKLTKQQLMIKQAINHALKGDFKPFITLMKIQDKLQALNNKAQTKEIRDMDLSELSVDELVALYRKAVSES